MASAVLDVSILVQYKFDNGSLFAGRGAQVRGSFSLFWYYFYEQERPEIQEEKISLGVGNLEIDQ